MRLFSVLLALFLARTGNGLLKCHYYAYVAVNGYGGNVTNDTMVECSVAKAKFCFTAVADIARRGVEIRGIFKGCNDDPVYGKITALKNDTVIDQCAANGHTAYSVPGLVSADIYCCDKDACNAETPAFPTTATVPAMATTVGGNGGGGGGGDQHRSASSATVGLFTVAAVVAVSAITRTML